MYIYIYIYIYMHIHTHIHMKYDILCMKECDGVNEIRVRTPPARP